MIIFFHTLDKVLVASLLAIIAKKIPDFTQTSLYFVTLTNRTTFRIPIIMIDTYRILRQVIIHVVTQGVMVAKTFDFNIKRLAN